LARVVLVELLLVARVLVALVTEQQEVTHNLVHQHL
jgi:hypothetical protein